MKTRPNRKIDKSDARTDNLQRKAETKIKTDKPKPTKSLSERLIHELQVHQIELERQNEELRSSMAEKEVMLREIHHRVKNNLQIVSSLMDLQSDTIKNEDARAALHNSKMRVLLIARLHQQLCQSDDLANVHVAGFLPDIARFLCQSYGKNSVIMQNYVDDIVLDVDRIIPCGLIVNELVTNALKHSFSATAEGQITIAMKRDGNEYELGVSNTGTPLPAGFDVKNAGTMGLRLLQMLTRQLHGALSVESGERTVFKVRFPV